MLQQLTRLFKNSDKERILFMGILVLKLAIDIDWYTLVRADSQADCLLKIFLDSARGDNNVNYYQKWLSDDNDDFAGSNSIQLQKHEGNIYITSEFDEREFPDECEIPIPTFAKMLDDWSEILKQEPPYIMVIHDGASLSIKGYDQDPSHLVK